MPHILVVGFGSAGRRHAANFARLGAQISAVDTRPDRLVHRGLTYQFASLASALATARFDGAVVATPTAFHVEQAQALLGAGVGVLLEKPMAVDAASARKLTSAASGAAPPILLGYTWRWWPALGELRRRLHAGRIGRPHRCDLVMASHLEDWHPGEPLSEFFMSRAELGGGALLDESHWLDQLIWLFGLPLEIAADVERVSALPIDGDDHVELRAFYPGGLRARVHLDLLSRPTRRAIAVYGDQGALAWSSESNRLREWKVTTGCWCDTPFGGERNDMFLALATEFLEVLAGRAQPACTLADGLCVMEVVEAARSSHSRGGCRVAIGPASTAAS